MALDAAHRSSIYQKLLPILGDEDANVLMSEFPALEAHELVTKDFLRAELALTRSDLRGEMSMLRDELRGEMSMLRDELRGEMSMLRDDLRGEMSMLRGEMSELRDALDVETSERRSETTSLREEIARTNHDIQRSLVELENRLTIRLGSAIGATAAVLAAIGLFN
jgi:hypothetical protein